MKKTISLMLLFIALFSGAAERVSVKAVLFPFREAVIAARTDSILLAYKKRIGEKFKSGDILAMLDDTRYAIEVKRTSEQFNFAKATFVDKKELRAKNFTSDYELRKAEFDFHMAENALADAKLNLSFCTVRAPFAGKIVEILTREHETIRPGQPLFRIIDDNTLLAILNVPMTDKTLTAAGSPVTLKLDAGGTVSGNVYEVTPQADHRTGTVRIRVLINNAADRFTAGMTGELLYDK